MQTLSVAFLLYLGVPKLSEQIHSHYIYVQVVENLQLDVPSALVLLHPRTLITVRLFGVVLIHVVFIVQNIFVLSTQMGFNEHLLTWHWVRLSWLSYPLIPSSVMQGCGGGRVKL